MSELLMNFKDDILAESMEGRRRYQMITNEDGTVSFVDVTEYEQMGSEFGQAEINAIYREINNKFDSGDVVDPLVVQETGFAADAKLTGNALREVNAKLAKKADTTAMNTALAKKADTTALNALVNRVASIENIQKNYVTGNQTGTVKFGTLYAGDKSQTTVVFPKKFTKTPSVSLSATSSSSGSTYLKATYSSVNASSFVIQVQNIDGARGVTDVSVTWSAWV